MLTCVHINVNDRSHRTCAKLVRMRRPRGKYHHGSLAHDALAATEREIDLHGHQGFTLDKVAKRLGVTAAALYRHYESREALLKAFVIDTFKKFAAEMDGRVTA